MFFFFFINKSDRSNLVLEAKKRRRRKKNAGYEKGCVFLFILFGAFLGASGGARFFNDLALSLAGRSPGGPAKVAVVAISAPCSR